MFTEGMAVIKFNKKVDYNTKMKVTMKILTETKMKKTETTILTMEMMMKMHKATTTSDMF